MCRVKGVKDDHKKNTKGDNVMTCHHRLLRDGHSRSESIGLIGYWNFDWTSYE